MYQEMGRVESLYLYPVKSLAPVPVPELRISMYMYPNVKPRTYTQSI